MRVKAYTNSDPVIPCSFCKAKAIVSVFQPGERESRIKNYCRRHVLQVIARFTAIIRNESNSI